MKQLLILFFFIISFGVQVTYAGFLNLGAAEIIMLLVVGFFTLAFVGAVLFLCLYLAKRAKTAKHEK